MKTAVPNQFAFTSHKEQPAGEPLSNKAPLVEAALIEAPSLAAEVIFRRPLLERLLLVCRRAGVKRFFIEASDTERIRLRASLGSFKDSPDVTFVGSPVEVLEHLPPNAPCVAMRGNLVLSPMVLRDVIARQADRPGEVVAIQSTDDDAHSGLVASGALGLLIDGGRSGVTPVAHAGQLPYALYKGREDVREAELRLARELRLETAWKDPLMARWVDRRLSWRISYRLANTPVTANQMTLAATALGLLSAWLFALPGYWSRLLAAVLFLVSTTVQRS